MWENTIVMKMVVKGRKDKKIDNINQEERPEI